jgi:hypothetical protein
MLNYFINWFFALTTQDKISLFALIVASYGAILSTSLYIKERLKLKMQYLNSCITISKSIVIDDYGEEDFLYNEDLNTIVIFVRLMNVSKIPTTVYNFCLNNKYNFDSCFDIEQSIIPTSFRKSDGRLAAKSSTVFTTECKKLKPLLELPPLSIVEGCLIFNNVKDVPRKFKIKVFATQKSKSFKFKFIFNADYRNKIS